MKHLLTPVRVLITDQGNDSTLAYLTGLVSLLGFLSGKQARSNSGGSKATAWPKSPPQHESWLMKAVSLELHVWFAGCSTVWSILSPHQRSLLVYILGRTSTFFNLQWHFETGDFCLLSRPSRSHSLLILRSFHLESLEGHTLKGMLQFRGNMVYFHIQKCFYIRKKGFDLEMAATNRYLEGNDVVKVASGIWKYLACEMGVCVTCRRLNRN